jgi:hypothetical protein
MSNSGLLIRLMHIGPNAVEETGSEIMTTVLRSLDHSDMVAPDKRLTGYVGRCASRPLMDPSRTLMTGSSRCLQFNCRRLRNR